MSTRERKWTGCLTAAFLATAAMACGGTALAGDADDTLEGDAGGDDGGDRTDLVDGWEDALSEDVSTSEDSAPTEDVGEDDGGPADDGDAFVDGIGIEPEATEVYVETLGGETIRPHRHAVPTARGFGVYLLAVDVGSTGVGLPLAIGLYRFDPAALELRQVWLDETGATTDYNSICWTGDAFVAALPTSRVGLRIVSLAADGTVLREPVVLEPDDAYSPVGAGQPPVVLCASDGPFVVDHGRGVGGTDRLYALAADGYYAGTFVDADLPSFSTTPYFASSPCSSTGAEVACATGSGLVFVRRDGTFRVSDAVPAPGICPSGMGCDVVSTDDGLAAVWLGSTPDRLALAFARFALDGAVVVPPVWGPDMAPMRQIGIRAASSGTTVLASGPGSEFDPMAPVQLYPFDTFGAQLGPSVMVGTEADTTTPLFWEGDAYAALWWVPEGPWAVGALAYRRFRLIEE
jgi:hypothetical protein